MSAMNLTRSSLPARPDFPLLALTALLTIIGLVVVWSASFVIALAQTGDANYFVIRQAIGAFLGAIGLVLLSRSDYRKLKSIAFPLLLVSIAALALVLFAEPRNGARRWLGFGEFSIQPAEFAKLSVTIYLAAWLVARGEQLKNFQTGFFPFVIIIGAVGALIMLEPSLGTTMVIVAIAVTMFYVAGAPWQQMAALVLAGAVMVLILATVEGYRMDRLSTFFGDPDPQGAGFQTRQALLALGNGGIEGLGLGASRGKFFYIPESHTDGVFAILGEETGLIMTTLVLLLYVVLILRGYHLARRCTDDFGAYIATGITTWIAVQTMLNIGGITSVLPLTGVPLPFMSYGNNALAALLLAVGVLMSISRYGVAPEPAPNQKPPKRQKRWRR